MEAKVAVSLIKRGYLVSAVRQIGKTSGHVDYDIIAENNDVTYALEVKSSIFALQEANSRMDSDITKSQLYRFTTHAFEDGYVPAIIIYDMRDTRSKLAGMWQALSKATDGRTPFLFDQYGNTFLFDQYGNNCHLLAD